MSPFFGTERYAIDSKGRVAIPASMRRDATTRKSYERFILLAGPGGDRLWLYTPEGFDEHWAEKLSKWQSGDRKHRDFATAFLQDAKEVTVDGQGRVTIPPALLGRAGLGKEAVLHGSYWRIEIFSPERYAAVQSLRDRMDAGEGDDILRDGM
jgi:transcriptional regulator MraZ